MKPIDWSRVDPEMVEVVKAINNLPHVRTIDSCIGHPGKMCNHQSHAFIGVAPKTKETAEADFFEFFSFFFSQFAGKIECMHADANPNPNPNLESWFQVSLSAYFDHFLTGQENAPMFRLHVSPRHDPAFNEIGVEEKKRGLQLISAVVKDYLEMLEVIK
jgi:hypothetical protein